MKKQIKFDNFCCFLYLCPQKPKSYTDMEQINMAIFASGNGSNCENIIRYFIHSNKIVIRLVLSNKPDAFVLERAKKFNIETAVVSKAELNDSLIMMTLMEKYRINFIVLAGFLPLVPTFLIDNFPHRIINLHPALLPKYGGKGMYGHHVHEAIKAAGETETGMTVHWVTPICDSGEIIAQFRVPISLDDTVDDIASKEHLLEMEHFPKVIEAIINDIMREDGCPH